MAASGAKPGVVEQWDLRIGLDRFVDWQIAVDHRCEAVCLLDFGRGDEQQNGLANFSGYDLAEFAGDRRNTRAARDAGHDQDRRAIVREARGDGLVEHEKFVAIEQGGVRRLADGA